MTTRRERRQSGSGKIPESGQKNWMIWAGAVIVVVAVAVVVFTAISPGNGGSADDSLLMSGGSFIGDPNAPVTLVEFGDFQ